MSSVARFVRLALTALAVACLVPALAQACPTCKDQLASDANSSGLVSGFFWSILFMLATPALLVTSWIAYVVYQLGESEAQAEKALPVAQARSTAEVEEARA
jgi:hypothetical protein